MAKNKVSEWNTSAASNTDIAGINIAEGCAPSGINNAIREVMAQIKDMQTGVDGDGFVVGGTFTASGAVVLSGSVTATISAPVILSSTVTMNGNNNIGNTTSSTILTGSVTQTSASRLYLDSAATTAAAPPLSWSGDTNTGIYHPAADNMVLVTNGTDRLKIDSTGIVTIPGATNINGNVILGTGDGTASVAGSILRAPAGTGTNIVGANFEIDAGNGTGTGGSGGIILKTASVGSTGSTANTLTQRLYVTPNGGLSFGASTTSYGTSGQVLKSNGDAPPSFGSAINSGTAVSSTSGTTIDFTNLSSTAKTFTVVLSGVSLSATALLQIQLGYSATPTYVTSGYIGGVGNASSNTFYSTGFVLAISGVAASLYSGLVPISNVTGNTWVTSFVIGANAGTAPSFGAGSIALPGALTAIRITSSGSDTFDAGSINILYE